MSCEKYLPLIDDLIEGEIEEQNAEQVNLHIFSCRECSAYYKNLKRETEMYAHYLFDVEPPADLWAQFQTKIDAEAMDTRALILGKTAAAEPFWKLNIFSFLRFYPAVGIAVVMILLGIGLFKVASDKTVSENQTIVQKNPDGIEAENQYHNEIVKKEETDLAGKIDLEKPSTFSGKVVKSRNKPISLNGKSDSETRDKIVAIKPAKKSEKISSERGARKILINEPSNEEQLQLSQLKNLESETARQVEKAELLLRSFRNARFADGSSNYDIAYEKQQARKLLEQNVRLRQSAEAYGNLYALELLDKVEPLLLDIANLENNPAQEKVLDIKERVKNQNIIASLQVY